MKPLEYYFELNSRSDEIIIIPYGDVHKGKSNHNPELLRRLFRYVKENDNVYLVDLGDLSDNISFSDKRFSVNAIPDELLEGSPKEIKEKLGNIYMNGLQELKKIIAPVADKHIVSVYGNHESKVKRIHHINLHSMLCDDLDIQNGGLACIVNLVFRMKGKNKASKVLRMYVKHRPKGGVGKTAGAKYNAITYGSQLVDADIYLTGHIHQPCHEWKLINSTTTSHPPKMKKIKKLFISVASHTDCMKDGDESYEEEANYSGSLFLIHKIRIKPFQGGLTTETRISVEEWEIVT